MGWWISIECGKSRLYFLLLCEELSMDFATLTITGPGPNAISHDTVRRLRDELAAAGERPVLLTGEGRAFSAGLDLKALATMTAEQFGEFLGDLEALGRDLFLHPAPTVASIHGHCVAGGYLIAACCERRISKNDDAIRFGLPAVRLGLQYPPVLLNAVKYAIHRESWEEVLLGAVQVGALRAKEMGMVEELVDDPRARAEEWLASRAKLPREAYAATKRSLREPWVTISEEEKRRFQEDVIPSWADPERLQRLLDATKK